MSTVELDVFTTDAEGRRQRLYECSYYDADGRHLSFYIYATCLYEAQLQLDDLKSTARVDGSFCNRIPVK